MCTKRARIIGVKAQRKRKRSYIKRYCLSINADIIAKDFWPLYKNQMKFNFESFIPVIRLTCPLSKMMPFLTNHIAQRVVMMISLKMLLPNASLAVMTMSNGCMFRFQ